MESKMDMLNSLYENFTLKEGEARQEMHPSFPPSWMSYVFWENQLILVKRFGTC